MANSFEILEAKDCCAFDSIWNEDLRYFSELNQSVSVFKLSDKGKSDEPIVNYNYLEKRWYAGRYIGNVNFGSKKNNCSIQIKPRFGDIVLLKMFEEIFNIKFSSGESLFKSDNKAYYLKLLVSFIWLQKLAEANRYGLPRIKHIKINESLTIKGRLLIRPSIATINQTGKVISSRKEQVFDQVIIRLLYQAHCILIKEYQLGLLKIPTNALDAIQNIESFNDGNRFVNKHEYHSIKYHPMYQNYKDIVDFSWQIIQSQPGYSDNNSKPNFSGFFLDMAEIWECYSRSIVKKNFEASGWQLSESKYEVYNQRFFKRKIIPDIVLKKGRDYCVFDAKYKDMQFRSGFFDVDRDDFFQIHTYISYMQTRGNVVLGGLIYPVTENKKNNETSPSQLFGEKNSESYFFVDGPVVESDVIYVDRFISSILNHLNRSDVDISEK